MVIFTLAGAIGSENENAGIAKFKNVFRYCSMSSMPCTSLYNSADIKPATSAVVVAIAGMIRPAMR